ncbi:hypothetical protein [Gimesia maris]|jgi:hypothetical protein|uniref:hypothetical protein n=1 Tax=Gimesia maris TaxID=122 RepID=UPI0030D76C94|tara:strand:+ start:136500 stop:136994 length:495 start_codon:yes stop_codon:yes gene_type:complete
MTTTPPRTRTRISSERRHQLLEAVKMLLGLHRHPSDIKRAISKEYQISPRSVERYITRARREMVESLTIPFEQLLAQSYQYYLYKLQYGNLSEREQIRCRERMDKLLGLGGTSQSRVRRWTHNLTPEKIQNMSDEELNATREVVLKDYYRSRGESYPRRTRDNT